MLDWLFIMCIDFLPVMRPLALVLIFGLLFAAVTVQKSDARTATEEKASGKGEACPIV